MCRFLEKMKHEPNNLSIGLILVKQANRIVLAYSLRDSTKPIGVAKYNIIAILPEYFQAVLPETKALEVHFSGLLRAKPKFPLNSHMDFLNHAETDRIIDTAFVEDIRDGDHTTLSTIPGDAQRKAHCLIKDDGIIAGVDLARKIFHKLDPEMVFDQRISDGEAVKYGDIAFYVMGNARAILSGERLVLNLMQRMSGIATFTHKMVAQLDGLNCKLLDTRKTTPLIRHLEKWAVKIGGGENHRFGLYDMIMIKDNHVDYAGGVESAIRRAQAYLKEKGLDLKIEVETRNLEEVREVLRIGGIHRIMLDNMSPDLMREAVAIIDGKYETEGSGNINFDTIRAKAETGVDFLSMGALTHSVKSLDISLKAVKI
ncbi:MAG TPA: carboxylating nicotinate-nucleotide diphosphorylase [Bacteroidetes bacterium]|nr:carboxylating nicotinate-nucleotide diphosphorylase [Bacteroidota bacterium]